MRVCRVSTVLHLIALQPPDPLSFIPVGRSFVRWLATSRSFDTHADVLGRSAFVQAFGATDFLVSSDGEAMAARASSIDVLLNTVSGIDDVGKSVRRTRVTFAWRNAAAAGEHTRTHRKRTR